MTTRASFIEIQLTITHHNLDWFFRWHNMYYHPYVFVTDQQLHTLIQLEVSLPSFDTGARMKKYLCGPQLNQIIDKDFGWGEIWTQLSQREADALTTTPQAFALTVMIWGGGG